MPPDMVTDEDVVTPNIVNAVRKVGTVEQLVRMLGMPPGFTLDRAPQEYVDTRCGAGLHVVAKHHLDASGLPITYVNVPTWIMFNLALFVATNVKPRRGISMPADTDSPRMWVSERDIAAVLARVLSDPVAEHLGREILLTSPDRYTYADIATVFTGAGRDGDVRRRRPDAPGVDGRRVRHDADLPPLRARDVRRCATRSGDYRTARGVRRRRCATTSRHTRRRSNDGTTLQPVALQRDHREREPLAAGERPASKELIGGSHSARAGAIQWVATSGRVDRLRRRRRGPGTVQAHASRCRSSPGSSE